MTTSLRKQSFKKTTTSDDARRRRESKSVQIRKNKRLEQQMKRRRSREEPTEIGSALAKLGQLPQIMQELQSGDVSKRSSNVKLIRQMLSKESDPPADEVIEAGFVPLFIEYLGCHDDCKLQFESAWALTNIASTARTDFLVEHNIIDALVPLLRSVDADVREQSLWCIGNIAGDRPAFRDRVIATPQAVESLLLNIKHPSSPSMIRNAVWTVSNLCRGKPQPPLAPLLPAVACLAECLKFNDPETLADSAWALSYVSDGVNERIKAVIDTGCSRRLIQLLNGDNVSIITPVLRTVGNIVSGDDSLTEYMVQANCLPVLHKLLSHSKPSIRKETCWTISNIAAGSISQVQCVCANEELLRNIINISIQDTAEVRKEATWILSNIISGGDTKAIKLTIKLGGLAALVELMDANDVKSVCLALDSVRSLFSNKGLVDEEYTVQFDELGGVDKLEDLQQHANDTIYEKAVDIIEKFFSTEEEVEDENIAPASSGTTFTFGTGVGLKGGLMQHGSVSTNSGGTPLADKTIISNTNLSFGF
eukprot:g5428.t1